MKAGYAVALLSAALTHGKDTMKQPAVRNSNLTREQVLKILMGSVINEPVNQTVNYIIAQNIDDEFAEFREFVGDEDKHDWEKLET